MALPCYRWTLIIATGITRWQAARSTCAWAFDKSAGLLAKAQNDYWSSGQHRGFTLQPTCANGPGWARKSWNCWPATISGHRHQTYWQLLEQPETTPLWVTEAVRQSYQDPTAPVDLTEIQLAAPGEGQDVLADYATQGLSLGRHPLALLREQGHLANCLNAEQLLGVRPGQPVQVAGLVTGRQRPGSASGVTFVTLEDETGNINVVVWLATARRQRKPLITARLLHVKGVIEREGDIIHLMAGKLTDLSHLIHTLPVSSRDFH